MTLQSLLDNGLIFYWADIYISSSQVIEGVDVMTMDYSPWPQEEEEEEEGEAMV